MPKKGSGYVSIAIKQEVMQPFLDDYEKRRVDIFREQGHASFSAYMTKKLYDLQDIEQAEKIMLPKTLIKEIESEIQHHPEWGYKSASQFIAEATRSKLKEVKRT